MKDDQLFKWFLKYPLQIRITDSNEDFSLNNYYLVVATNHSGSLSRGHYWTFIKHDTTNQWFSCNDKLNLMTSITKHHMCSFL